MKKICYPALFVLLVIPVAAQAVAPFNYPECVVYHPGTDRYFISNEGNGTIVQIDANRDTTYFSTDLPLAVGMTIRGDTLYVSATPDGIAGFDLTGDTLALIIPIPGHTRLNDVCADSSGNLWITDAQGGKVFKANIESRSSLQVASGVSWANGIHYDVRHNRILINQWISNSPIQAMDPDDFTLSTVATPGYDNLNGLTDDDRGNYYISAWGEEPYTDGMIIKFDSTFGGPPVVFSQGHRGSGDMCYNQRDSIMVIPNVQGQTVDFIVDLYVDHDGDGILSVDDNCPYFNNPEQEDGDGDGVGDGCDNCPDESNPQQEDINGNGIGDACEVKRSWYVHPEGGGDVHTIQEGVDLATHNDTVIVADGLYTGEGNRTIAFGGRQGLLLRSENGPRFAIIDCQGSVGNPRRAFTFAHDEDSTFVIDGFTIRGGYGPEYSATSSGGAMLFDVSSPTVKNCVFTGNAAALGGALFSYHANPQLIGCTFADNSATQGAALFLYASSSVAPVNCLIAFNQGGQPVVCLAGSEVVLACCDVYGNSAGDWVGSISGQLGIDGNFSADPLFCNVGIGDVGLIDETSPCVPANNDCGVLLGALGVGCACNCGFPGDMDCSDNMDPVDAAYLVSFVYLAQDALCAPPNCPFPVGDLDCDGEVNPLDVAYIVNAVYKSQNAICSGCAM